MKPDSPQTLRHSRLGKHAFAARCSIPVLLIVSVLLTQATCLAQHSKVKSVQVDETTYKSSRSKQATILYNKGVIELSVKNRPDEAITFFKQALEVDPFYVEALDELGICYRKLNDYEQAKNYYKQSLAIFPKGSCALGNLALIYQMQNQNEEAVKLYSLLTKNEPNNPEGFYGLAVTLYKTKQFDEATQNAHKALEFYRLNSDPNVKDAELLLSQIRTAMGGSPQAQ